MRRGRDLPNRPDSRSIRRGAPVEGVAGSVEERLAAVAELASLALPVGSPAEMKAESVETPEDCP